MGKDILKGIMATDEDIDAIISGAFQEGSRKGPGAAGDKDADPIITEDDPAGKEIDRIIKNAFGME